MAETIAGARARFRLGDRLSGPYLVGKALHAYLSVFVHPPRDRFEVSGYLHELEGRFLYWLARRVPPGGLALEVGSFKGKSSGFLAAGLPTGARLACVDTWQNDAMPYDARGDVLAEFKANLRAYEDRVEICRGRSSAVAAGWHRPIDLLFVDGEHSYEGCSGDLKAWTRFVSPGGWIALHDSSEEGVRSAIDQFFPPSRRRASLCAWSIFAARTTGGSGWSAWI